MSAKSFVNLLLCACLVLVTCEASWLRFLELPKHDGVSRVCQITETRLPEVESLLGQSGTKVIIVESAEKHCPYTVQFAEITAQLLEPDQIKVCSLKLKNPSILTNTTVLKGLGVHVFVNGGIFRYQGKRDVVSFLSYLKKLRQSEVRVISGKLDKAVFDAVQRPKVVGFFVKGTADYLAFLEAAKIFTPADIPFFSVHDRVVAKHLKLETVGQINIHKPLLKIPVSCAVNPASVADIAVFVNSHRGTGFFHLTQNNFEQAKYDFELSGDTTPVVLAVGEQGSPNGSYFYKLLMKAVRNSTDLLNEKFKVVWIDPEEFPVINVVGNLLIKQFGLPNELPAMGILDETSNATAWLGFKQLNMTADKQADEQNLRIIKQFLEAVANGTVSTMPAATGGDSLIRAPKSLEVHSGSIFELDCIVREVQGDCLWLRNGKLIGYNLDRFPHYSWAGDVTKGDCSLRVIGALPGRDDGLWVCQVTGDATRPDIISAPAQITVVPPPAPAIFVQETTPKPESKTEL